MSISNELLISDSFQAEWVQFVGSERIQTLFAQLTQTTEQVALTQQQSAERLALLHEQTANITASLRATRAMVDRIRSRGDNPDSPLVSIRLALAARLPESVAARVLPTEVTLLKFSRLQDDQEVWERAIAYEEKRLSQTVSELTSQRQQLNEGFIRQAEEWAFDGGEERVLQYALVNFGEDGFSRNQFFRRFSWRFGGSSAQVYNSLTSSYNELTTPIIDEFMQRNDQLIAQIVQPVVEVVQSSDGVETSQDEPAIHWSDWQIFSQGRDKQAQSDQEVKSSYQRQVILECLNSELKLEEVEGFDDLVKESQTPIHANQLREIIAQLANSDNPVLMYQRYPNTVKEGPYKGYHVLKRGRKGRVLFCYDDGKVHIRFGDYYQVYADRKRWQG